MGSGVSAKSKQEDLASLAVENGADQPFDPSLLEAVEKYQASVEVLDVKAVRKLANSFDRRVKGNVEAQLKYPNQLDKFVDSELQKLNILAGASDLYPELVNLDTVKKLVGLLNHDNFDISIDVVSLLQDLTDEDVIVI